MNTKDVCNQALAIKDNIKKVIVGKDNVIDLVLTCIIANGHILLEDTPGTGKTLLAKSLSKSFDADFNRIQFTPDLLPSDVTGLNIYNQKDSSFNFIEGPVFTNILLADEINRATPRTQSSLLECMEERQVTVDGKTRKLDDPFLVIATQNPIETAGTFPLPEAQLDRFMIKLNVGYPSSEEEVNILNRFLQDDPLYSLNPVCDKNTIIEMRAASKQVFIHPELLQYIVNIIQATRNHQSIALGVSPRGSLAFIKALQAYAAINGRNYVIPEDIKKLAIPIMAHRTITFSTNQNSQASINAIQDILSSINVPTEEWEK